MFDYTAFLSYVLVTSFTPGPNNIMSMSNASRYGFRKSILFNFGVFFGFLIIISLCSIFSAVLYRVVPTVKPVMTFFGALYILWLAWKTYQSEPHNVGRLDKSTNTFRTGFLLQFVNIKVILFGITTVSTFILPYYKSLPILEGFSVLLAFIGFAGTCCWSLFGSLFQAVLNKRYKLANIIMALLLVYCAISLYL